MGAQVIDFAAAVKRLDEQLAAAVRRQLLAIAAESGEEPTLEPGPEAA